LSEGNPCRYLVLKKQELFAEDGIRKGQSEYVNFNLDENLWPSLFPLTAILPKMGMSYPVSDCTRCFLRGLEDMFIDI